MIYNKGQLRGWKLKGREWAGRGSLSIKIQASLEMKREFIFIGMREFCKYHKELPSYDTGSTMCRYSKYLNSYRDYHSKAMCRIFQLRMLRKETC